ncbi:40S ribosomal protein S12 [Galemys pyrenaicus]|uniref:40S ribosomal protein S12 n=1 Tax=Galemys pyrenaicus TaxID=202257 RepID=A0A8J6A4T3_GALPY|nr:40S ribosomal protein S12 [Galemys pyrenaicus]
MTNQGTAAGGLMDINTNLKRYGALIHNGLACEIHKPAKALDKHEAHLLCVAMLVEVFCAEHQLSLVEVDGKKQGE